jgi:nucleoside-diphosphate-sugar epimerase
LKALITGGAGFIGSNICRRLVADGHAVRVVDNLSSGRKSNLDDVIGKIEFIHADMGDPAVAKAAMKDIEVVFHHGAQVSVPASVDDPANTHRNCIDATFALLMAARDAKVRRFVYAASSAAYGDDPAQPKVETMLPKPISPYAIGKLTGEYYCSVFYKCFGLQTISLRYFNVFGPYQDPKSQYAAAIPAFITLMLNDKQPTIYGDGEQTRDFTYIDNVISANLLAAQAKETAGQVLNIASGKSVTVNETVETIAKLLGKQAKPIYAPPRQGDVKYSSADISLAAKTICFKPVVSFHDGMAKVIDWYKCGD